MVGIYRINDQKFIQETYIRFVTKASKVPRLPKVPAVEPVKNDSQKPNMPIFKNLGEKAKSLVR